MGVVEDEPAMKRLASCETATLCQKVWEYSLIATSERLWAPFSGSILSEILASPVKKAQFRGEARRFPGMFRAQ